MLRGKERAPVLAAALAIVVIGAAAVAGGAFAAGRVRPLGSMAPAPLATSELAASGGSDAFGSMVSSAWPTLPGAAPVMSPFSLTAVPAGQALGSTFAFAPQGATPVANVPEPAPAWTKTPSVGQTSDGVTPWTPLTRLVAPLPVLFDQPTVAGPRVPGDDGGTPLGQSPSSGEATAAPDEQAREANLATQLANPVSSLISVPFQQNIQFGIGPANAGWQDVMNIQPVVPFSISRDWNLIARMIMPVVYQDEIFPGAGSQFGIGDTAFQFFFSPKAPTKNGVIWGVGPLFIVPSGAYLLSANTWGAGVDAVVVKQVPMRYMGAECSATARSRARRGRSRARPRSTPSTCSRLSHIHSRTASPSTSMPKPRTTGPRISGRSRWSRSWAKSTISGGS